MKKIIIEENLKNFLINEKTPILIKVLNFLSCFLFLSLFSNKKWEKNMMIVQQKEVKLDRNFLLSWLKLFFSFSHSCTMLTHFLAHQKCRKRQRVEEQENMWNWKN